MALVAVLSSAWVKAQNVNIDKQTFEQLSINVAAQITTNELHNRQVDSIKKKQSKLLALVEGIAGEKELIIQTYKNVSGFKKESKYYVAMVSTCGDIVKHSREAKDAINKSKWTGKARMIIDVSDLVTDAVSLGKAFADIVANSEVPNPLSFSTGSESGKDKHNLLNRHERLSMANDILFRLRKIDWTLRYLTYICKTASFNDLLFHLDRETYTTYIMTKINIGVMLNKWRRLEK